MPIPEFPAARRNKKDRKNYSRILDDNLKHKQNLFPSQASSVEEFQSYL